MQDYVGFDPVSKRVLYLSNQADHIDDESLDFLTKTLRSHPRSPCAALPLPRVDEPDRRALSAKHGRPA